LRLLDEAQLPQLAQELRNFIIDVVSVKEGISAPVWRYRTHHAHYVFNTQMIY
jgi:1-deoxy-D-xylulose-5-phosphate synthase